MEPISIKQATVNDIPFLRAMSWEAVLASPAFIEAHHGLDALREEDSRRWATWQPQEAPVFIAVDAAGRNLGSITLRRHPAPSGEGWQFGIGVVADARGQGVGRQLVEHAIAFVQDLGAPYLTLYVDMANAPAIALYQHTGFIAVEEHDNVQEMRLTFAEQAQE